MEIYNDTLMLSSECRDLRWPVHMILEHNSERGLTFNEIKKSLINDGILFNDADLFLILNIMIANDKNVVRDEFWNGETTFRLLDRYYWEHSSQKAYYSFKDDLIGDKTFLVISDTHIGSDIFSAKLLHNLYEYGIMMGAKKCFHLGDLFEGSKDKRLIGNARDLNVNLFNAFEEEFCRQVKLFAEEYPKPAPNELMTYCLIGNHDVALDNFLKFRAWFKAADLRKLSIYNPSFYMFPRKTWITELNNIDIHFNHRLYMSGIINDLKINSLDDIDVYKEKYEGLMLDLNYEFFLSGHLHQGIIHSEPDYRGEKNNLYLGAPSASKINVGKTVGYLVHMYSESNSMEISVLGCDNNLRIFEKERIPWEFGTMNRNYRRTL